MQKLKLRSDNSTFFRLSTISLSTSEVIELFKPHITHNYETYLVISNKGKALHVAPVGGYMTREEAIAGHKELTLKYGLKEEK